MKEEFNLLPTTFSEATKFAEIISHSSFCPVQFKGKPNDVLIAIQMGRELNLQPLQALQNIAVINGKPSIYGDAMLAVCRSHPDFEFIVEEQTDSEAYCIIKRKGNPEIKSTFTVKDAEIAGLWGKAGPWKTYPKRMLQMRARGFALRDSFPDALKGLISSEEAQDYPEKDITPIKKTNLAHPSIDKKFEDVKKNLEIPKEISGNLIPASYELVSKLRDLLIQADIQEDNGLVNKWITASGVNCLEEMSEYQINSCIYLMEKRLLTQNKDKE